MANLGRLKAVAFRVMPSNEPLVRYPGFGVQVPVVHWQTQEGERVQSEI